MEIIRHRVNTIAELKKTDPRDGVEIDVRSRSGRLILAHEPHSNGDLLKDYLDVFARTHRHRMIIFNPKEDGLDVEIRKMASRLQIRRYFFLDLSLPSIVRMCVRGGESRAALRVSEYELASSANTLKKWVDWAWLDCFSGKPPAIKQLSSLRRSFSVCLVSPELEGYSADRISTFKHLKAEAVCTKHPEMWR